MPAAARVCDYASLKSHIEGGKHRRAAAAPRDRPEAELECRDCKPPRAFASAEGCALHRRFQHGVALSAKMRSRIEADTRSSNRPALAARAERVPAAAVGLPWVRRPADPTTFTLIVGRVDAVAGAAMSEAEVRFWRSVRAVAAEIVSRAS